MSRKKAKSFFLLILIILILILAFYFITGFYVIPPGAVSKGSTNWFVRLGTHYPFISSPASILRTTNNLNSMKTNLKKVLNFPKDKIIATFKYSDFLYSFTEK